jgi:ribulose-phosphate 3-epimerase
LDVHLMIEHPERYVEAFVKAGATYLTVHVETVGGGELSALFKKIRALGAKPGLTLRPGTPFSQVEKYIAEIDLLLIMTVEPGFGGQQFRVDQLEKIAAARKAIDQIKKSVLLEADGGINVQTLKYLAEVDVLVAGNAVFKAADYATAIRDLKQDRSAE